MDYKEIKNRTEMINSIIEKTLIKELNNIEEVESESSDLIEEESKKDNNWLRNNYKITLLYKKFKIKNQEVNVIINDITIKDAYSLSVVNNTVNKIRGKKYYISIDLVSRYW